MPILTREEWKQLARAVNVAIGECSGAQVDEWEALRKKIGDDGEKMVEKTMQLRCNVCGEIVSTPVSLDTVVRAWIQCPECAAKEKD